MFDRSNLGLWVVGIACSVFVALVVAWAIDTSADEQKKQDACLSAGGLWIDNQSTDSYCFFNNK